MAFFAEDSAADFRLERHLIVLSAIVADDLKARWCFFTCSRFFCTTFCAPLRRHHITLVKGFLFLFCEQKGLFTLNTRNLNVGHLFPPNLTAGLKVMK